MKSILFNFKFCYFAVLLILLWRETSTNEVISSALHVKLFGNYKTDLLPVCKMGPRFVNVSLNIALRQIINLDEKDQVLKTNVWVRMLYTLEYLLELLVKYDGENLTEDIALYNNFSGFSQEQQINDGWTDCQLQWNVSDYDGVDHLRVPYSAVWIPDIALYDSSAEEVMMPGLTDYRAQIFHDGSVKYNFPTVFNSVCRVKVTYFPFDTQSCKLKFGSWSHTQTDLDFYPVSPSGRNGDLGDFINNNEWEVRALRSVRNVKNYTELYTDVEYSIIMSRRSSFYVMTMMFPCILVSAIAAIGFLLPSESGEKVSLEVTVLLSQAVFLLVISDFLPPSSDNFPILGTYFAVSMLLVSMSLVMSVLVLNVHHRGDVKGKSVPRWTRKYLLKNPKSCCTRTEYDLDSTSSASDNKNCHQVHTIEETNIDTGIRENGIGMMGHSSRRLSNTDNTHKRSPKRLKSLPQLSFDQESYNTQLSELLLREQNRTLQHIEKHFVHTDDNDDEREEWQKLARILDRIFLLLYVVCFVIITVVFVIQLNSFQDTDLE